MSENAKENRYIKTKIPTEKDLIWFLSDEKNFDQDHKVNGSNSRWLCANYSDAHSWRSFAFRACSIRSSSTWTKQKCPAIVIFLGVVSNEGHVMPLYFYPQGLRVNVVAYIEVLKTIVKSCIDSIRNVWKVICVSE